MTKDKLDIAFSRILVVAAHPDDEVLGCGGTIARLAASGVNVRIVIVAEGATSRGGAERSGNHAAESDDLRQAANQAAKILGAEAPRFVGLPDNRLDRVEFLDIVKRIEAEVVEFYPDTVFTHFGGDLNIDHQLTHRAVLTACRPLPNAPVRTILCFETVSSTEWSSADQTQAFRPNLHFNISDFLELKLSALDKYQMEMRTFPHARSLANVEALARWRGASVGLEAAEAFQVTRIVI